MVDLIQLTQALVDTWRLIPPLITDLNGDPNNISAYIDENPEFNSVERAVYEMPQGSILLAWYETAINEGEAGGGFWVHRFRAFLRAAKNSSVLTLVRDLMSGIPAPGDGQRWFLCPVMDGVFPTDVMEIGRPTDQEGIDYVTVTMQIREVGDQ